MPLARPPLGDLVTRVKSDLRGRLSFGSALLRRAMADALAAVWAGAVHLTYGRIEWASEQLFLDTAERPYVLRKAGMYGIRPTAATYASGPATATGTNGSVIPADTILVRDDGVRFRVTADATIASGAAALALVAVLAGEDGNTDQGLALSFESPLPGVNSSATVGSGGLAGGFDEEDTDGTRDRGLLRLREPPEGGADQDYEAWALAVAGVTRAWPYANELGLGTVVVRFVMDDNELSIFPGPTEVAAVQAALDAQRPITAEVTALAPTPLLASFQLSVTPDTTAVRAAVEAELADLLLREAEPGDGAGRGTIRLSHIQVAIGVAEGVEDFDLALPAADIVPAVGELAVMGSVTWV